MTALRSPTTSRPLAADTPHSLAAPGERWPVVDGIPYLRAGSETLAAQALAAMDAGDEAAALVILLAENDTWWDGPPPRESDLRRLVGERDRLSLRAAMALLGWGRVADYFAYRWVDPTYLAGLSLMESHWRAPATAFELACGIGHYLRDLGRRGVECTGADVVFAKCWVAKHWVAPDARYIVFDAGRPWPVEEPRFDLVACHDAFYFLEDQEAVARRLRGLMGERGGLMVSHLHNADYRAGATGPARPAEAWAALFPQAVAYDEQDLLWALLGGWTPRPTALVTDDRIEAWSVVERAGAPRAPLAGLALPSPASVLRPNPLLGTEPGPEGVRWPSDRWREDYADGCIWAERDEDLSVPADPVRLRRLVDLPERW